MRLVTLLNRRLALNEWHITVIFLISAKAISFAFLYLQSIFEPELFKTYAAISISSGLIASVLVLGWPYIVPVSSQSNKSLLSTTVFTAVLYVLVASYFVTILMGGGGVLLLSILLSSLPAVIVPAAYESLNAKKAAVLQSLIVFTLQPLIYLIVCTLPQNAILVLPTFANVLIAVGTMSIVIMSIRNHLKLFVWQSLNIVIGQAIGVFVISKSVLDINNFDSSLLWILIQLSSVVLFITNSMSFKLLSHLMSTDKNNAHEDCEAHAQSLGRLKIAKFLYMFQLLYSSILLVCGVFYHWFYYYAYPLLNIGQGVVKPAGQIVLSLRKPEWQLIASSVSFIAMVIFLYTQRDNVLNFQMSVATVFVGVLTSTALMIYFCSRSLSRKNKVVG